MSNRVDDVEIQSGKRSLRERISIIWLLPILAVVIALGVAWKSYNDKGPLVNVTFENGEGIKAGETKLSYRDVQVGTVEEVNFTSDLSAVVASVRVDKDVAPFVDSGAKFWIVRPEVSLRGVTGLSTVLSGVFIEGSWDNNPAGTAYEFRGLDQAPLIQPEERGLQIALRSGPDSTLADNAPILFRGIEVGRIGRAQIGPNGGFSIAEALIYEPYRNLITTATRFWDASGISFSFGAGGAEVDFTSLSTLISGGVTFDNIVSGGRQIPDGHLFTVYDNDDAARASLFQSNDVETLELSVIFEDNVAGLTKGAAVELGGLRIGEVSNLSGLVDSDGAGDARVRLNATLSIQPARLGLPGDATPESALDFITEQVASGLRARLVNASVLTGSLKVELIKVEDPSGEVMDLQADPYPLLPTTESMVSDVSNTAEGLFSRINNLPVEELMQSAIDFLNAGRSLVASEDVRETPADVRKLIGDMRGLVGSEAAQNIPVALNATLVEMQMLASELREQELALKLTQALEDASTAAQSVSDGAAGVPGLIENLNSVAAVARDLPLDQLVNEATGLMTSANALVSSPETAQVPEALADALREIRASLQELREGGAVNNLNEALASARSAADSVANSTDGLPALVERVRGVLDQAAETLRSYDGKSAVNRDAQRAMREITKAAEAVTSLAKTIERSPNSLLLGR